MGTTTEYWNVFSATGRCKGLVSDSHTRCTGGKKKINPTAWTSMDVSSQNISVQEVPPGASTCSKIRTLKSEAMEAFGCFSKKMSTKI